jgi:hypothetical protein
MPSAVTQPPVRVQLIRSSMETSAAYQGDSAVASPPNEATAAGLNSGVFVGAAVASRLVSDSSLGEAALDEASDAAGESTAPAE